jgi:hypothetical protein
MKADVSRRSLATAATGYSSFEVELCTLNQVDP